MFPVRSFLHPSEVLLPSFLSLDGVQDGLPLGLVALTDLLDLLLHLRVQRGQTQTQLFNGPRAHLRKQTENTSVISLFLSDCLSTDTFSTNTPESGTNLVP